MKHLGKLMRVAVVLAMAGIYILVVWLGLTEESRRSLILTKNSPTSGDYVMVSMKVTAFDPIQGVLRERIRVTPMGRFALDQASPAVDLKLLINSVSGNQTVVYPKGERISPLDFTSVLSGNPNRYPFDRYTSDIDLLVTAPTPPPPRSARPARVAPVGPAAAKGTAPTVTPVPEVAVPADGDTNTISTALVVGATDLTKSEQVPINENFVASIPGVRFDGGVTEDNTYKLVRTSLVVRRARNVISVSIAVMGVMFILAVSVMVMALRVAGSPTEINLLPLSLCISLIFGLPALRGAQPGVPGVGALGDYLSFMWAEFIVTSAAIGLAWTWIVRTYKDRKGSET